MNPVSSFYSRPPLFMEVRASTPHALSQKIAEIDRKLVAVEADQNRTRHEAKSQSHSDGL